MLRSPATVLQDAWYRDSRWLLPLYPLGRLTARVARRRLERFRKRAEAPPVPVLVVGNVTVGGTGKTPLVIALCRAAMDRGLKVAVISRGYGARPPSFPWDVTPDQHPRQAGDEPLLVARSVAAPVVIDPRRRRALAHVVREYQPDLVISDDGLQHYRLPRSAEIAVIDGARELGNGRCLPAGPLREPAQRLREVDWVVVNGGTPEQGVVMSLAREDLRNLVTGERLSMQQFGQRFPRALAVAGIGDPERFFRSLEQQGLTVERRALPDHHLFHADDLATPDDLPVIMTEKDAVKCQPFAGERCWALPVTAELPEGFIDSVLEKLMGKA